jgi:hypothetical protein
MWYWLGPVIVVVLIVGYAIFRMSREDEELEPGGSYGEQLGGKKSDTHS